MSVYQRGDVSPSLIRSPLPQIQALHDPSPWPCSGFPPHHCCLLGDVCVYECLPSSRMKVSSRIASSCSVPCYHPGTCLVPLICGMNELGAWGKWEVQKCSCRNLCVKMREIKACGLRKSPAEGRCHGRLTCHIQVYTETGCPAAQWPGLASPILHVKRRINRQVYPRIRNGLVTPGFTDLFIFVWQRKAHFDIWLHSPQQVWIYGIS